MQRLGKYSPRLLTNLFSNIYVRICSMKSPMGSSYFESIPMLISDMQDSAGTYVTVEGWVKSIRKHKEVTFVDISDGSTVSALQAVYYHATLPDGLRPGCCAKITGQVRDSKSKLSSEVELKARDIEVVSTCDSSFPIRSHQPLEEARVHLHLRPRLTRFARIMQIRSAATLAIHKHFHDEKYTHVHVPVLTQNNCEGGSEVFRVESPANPEYFPLPVFLSVSGQLHLEAMATEFRKVYSFGPTFRADKAVSQVHLSEFYMLEAELAFVNELDDIMNVVENCYKSVTNDLLKLHGEEIAVMQKGIKGVSAQVNLNLSIPFERMSYEKALTVLQNSGVSIKWGDDFKKVHERALVQHAGNWPVFVTDFPKSLRPFYMKENDDEKTVACFDLLLPGIGEVAGGSLREHRYEHLDRAIRHHSLQSKKRQPSRRPAEIQTLEDKAELSLKRHADLGECLSSNGSHIKSDSSDSCSDDEGDHIHTSGLIPSSLEWYLEMRRYGSVAHGGFGFGFERYLKSILGVEQIRDTIPFPRYLRNCRH